MFSQITRYTACSLIGVATLFLALGALLFQAASVTGAASNYGLAVSWSSVFRSVVWPPSRLPFLLLLGVFLLGIFTLFIFFRLPRSIGVAVLSLQAVVAASRGGGLGWFFILREFETYHFNMDAEKLGEHWFGFEALGIWTLAVAALAIMRLLAPKQPAEASSQRQLSEGSG